MCVCVCVNNEKGIWGNEYKKISLVSNLMNIFPRVLSETIFHRALLVRLKKLQERFLVKEGFHLMKQFRIY